MEGGDYCEKHRKKQSAVVKLEPPPPSLRCAKSDGRGWQCRERKTEGGDYCEKHRKKQSAGVKLEPPPPSLRCAKSDGRGWQCRERKMEGGDYCEKHRKKHNDSAIKLEPPPQSLRCARNGGGGWQCRERKTEGGDYCEKHRKKQSAVVKLEPPPPSLRCARNDGRGWQCRERKMEGGDYCEKHRKKQSAVVKLEPPPPSLRCAKSDGRGWQCRKRKMEGDYCEKHRKKHYQSAVVKLEPPPPSLRCAKSDGRGWQCRERKMEGGNYCEKHRKKHNLAKSTASAMKLEPPPPSLLRCTRNDGKGWQCRERKMEGGDYCEKHRKKHYQAKSTASAGAPRVTTHESKKKSCVSPTPSEEYIPEKRSAVMKLEPPPPSLRCARNAGNGWQCRERKMKGDDFCEKHRKYYQEKAQEKKTRKAESDDHRPGKRRCRESKYISDDPNDPFQMCHQCMKSDREVIRCSKCPPNHPRRYCFPCVKTWYPELSVEAIAKECPCCRKNCNCKACLRGVKTVEAMYSGDPKDNKEKIRFLKYLIRLLLPFLEQLCHDQTMEKEMEANIRGSSPSEVKIDKIEHPADERIDCNNCRTAIVDFHRSCPKCLYDLCMTCCRKIREGCLKARDKKVVIQYVDRGPDYLHGKGTSKMEEILPSMSESNNWSNQMPLPEWRPMETGEIPCPPKERGGCGHGHLELKCIFGQSWVPDMKEKAETFAVACGPADIPQILIQCSCLKLNEGVHGANGQLRKGASRKNSGDNFLYSPLANDIQPGELEHFQRHWIRGEPIIVRDVLKLTSGLSWNPMVMWRAFCEILIKNPLSDSGVTAVDCLDMSEVHINFHQFFKEYKDGCRHKNGWPKMLKLKDWSPSALFEERLPRHAVEFLSALPYKEYTHPRCGILNLASKLSTAMPKPNLGPKTYIAYGFSEELGRGDSVTKLHCDMSDVVNILMHTADVVTETHHFSAIQKLKERHAEQDQKELFCSVNADKEGTRTVVQEANAHVNLEAKCSTLLAADVMAGGAVWDIFRRQDVPRLEKYLQKHHKEFRHKYGCPVPKVVHPIHDQSLYLNSYHKAKLKEEFGIEPWTFVQHLGEAVFIPAGCPHQVRNLKSCIKVAQHFVSPESLAECVRLTEELRILPKNHRAKKDKLEVKMMALHALHSAVSQLEDLIPRV